MRRFLATERSSLKPAVSTHFLQRHPALFVLPTQASFQRMATAATFTTAHIKLDAHGVAWIDDTNTKVIEVAQDMIAHGWSPEEIHFQHPHLSLAQIHAALGFYYDHQPEFDATMQESLRRGSELRDQAAESPIRKRLRELGKLA
jgi:uncharacterized protein (DUF433 family)